MTQKFDELPPLVQNRWNERLPGDAGEILKIVVFGETDMPFSEVKADSRFSSMTDNQIRRACLNAARDLYEENGNTRRTGSWGGTNKGLYTTVAEKLVGKARDIIHSAPGTWEFYHRLLCAATRPIAKKIIKRNVSDQSIHANMLKALMYTDPTELRSVNGQEPFSVDHYFRRLCNPKEIETLPESLIRDIENKLALGITGTENSLRNGDDSLVTNHRWRNIIDPKSVKQRHTLDWPEMIKKITEDGLLADSKLFTPRQRDVLNIYVREINSNNPEPSMRKIAAELDISVEAVSVLLDRIAERINGKSGFDIKISDRRK